MRQDPGDSDAVFLLVYLLAEMVSARGGKGIWVQVDHTQPDQVIALFDRINQEQNGQLDILVNDLSGDWFCEWTSPDKYKQQRFWEHNLDKGLKAVDTGVHSHIITSHYAAKLMVKRKRGVII